MSGWFSTTGPDAGGGARRKQQGFGNLVGCVFEKKGMKASRRQMLVDRWYYAK
jgi:hypothetical protein